MRKDWTITVQRLKSEDYVATLMHKKGRYTVTASGNTPQQAQAAVEAQFAKRGEG